MGKKTVKNLCISATFDTSISLICITINCHDTNNNPFSLWYTKTLFYLVLPITRVITTWPFKSCYQRSVCTVNSIFQLTFVKLIAWKTCYCWMHSILNIQHNMTKQFSFSKSKNKLKYFHLKHTYVK